ncbi:MAG: SPOR domain-containing protein [Burkholderiales bacterium]|nr:SPOR domain-containing protein [Burkholderiales bacterium]
MMQQRGGTLVGFIIGVLVGLGSALAVAVYVTKVPVPFLNKGESRSAEQDAAENKKNKDWDPNAPLYGKNPAKPAQPAASEPLAAASGAASAALPAMATPAPAVLPGLPAKVEAKPAAGADPLGDLAKARTATPAPAAAATAGAVAEPFSYFVQVGAFRTPEDAESQRARLSLGGIETRVSEREQSGRTVYRVRVGPFDKRDEAERAKEKLEASGLETALVRVQR